MANLLLLARAGLNTSGFDESIRHMAVSAKSLGSKLTKSIAAPFAGYFTFGALKSGVQSAIEYGGRINDLSSRTNIATDTLQEMDYWLKQNGGSLDSAVTGVTFLSKAMIDAAQNVKGDAAKAFEFFGVSIDNLASSRPEDIFKHVANMAGKLGDSAQKTDAILQLMGRGSMGMMPAFKAGFAESADEAHRLGLVIDKELIKKLDDLGDRFDQMFSKLMPTLGAIGGFVADIGDAWIAISSGIKDAGGLFSLLNPMQFTSKKGHQNFLDNFGKISGKLSSVDSGFSDFLQPNRMENPEFKRIAEEQLRKLSEIAGNTKGDNQTLKVK